MIDLAAVRKTQSQINAAIWGCAGIAMSASAIAGITGFWNLQHDGWGLASGLTTSVAVDTALWVALTSDQLMERAGLAADGPWARAVGWGTAVMSIFLNVLAAVLSPIEAGFKFLLIVIHAFAPLIMVGLAELRTENGRKLAAREREALEQEEAKRSALDTPIVAPFERTSPAIPIVSVPDPKLASEVAELRAELARVKTLTPAPPAPKPPRTVVTPLRPATESSKNHRSTSVTGRIVTYLNTHHQGDPYGITAEILASKTKQNMHTCKKVLTDWRRGQTDKSQRRTATP